MFLFFTAFFLCAEASAHLTAAVDRSASFWLPAGLTVAVLLLNRTRDWPWLLLAALPANIIFDLLHGTNLIVVLFFFTANTVQAVSGAWLVRRFVAERPALATLKEFIGLTAFAAVFGPMLGALIGAGELVHAGFSDSFVKSWEVWWGSSAMAVLLLTSLILTWFITPTRTIRKSIPATRIMEAVLLFLGLSAFAWFLLVRDKGIMSLNKSPVIPLLLWAGLRFGTRGATAASLFLALVFSFFTTQFHIGLTPAQLASGDYVFVMQVVLAMMVLVSLIPAIVLGQRDRMTAKLRESEELFRTSFENATVGVCLLGTDGKFLKVNHTLCQMLGYAREELEKLAYNDVTHDEDTHIGETFIARALAGGPVGGRFEKRYWHKDGHLIWGEVSSALVEQPETQRRYLISHVQDITEKKQSAELLQASEKRFRTLLEKAPVAVSISRSGTTIYANQKYLELYGFQSVDELVGQSISSQWAPEFRELIEERARLRARGEPVPSEYEGVGQRKDGSTFPVHVAVTLVDLSDGAASFAILTDITERTQAVQALRETKEQIQYVINNTKDVIFQIDLQGNYLYGNAAAERLTGYPLSQILRMNMMQLVVPEHHPLIQERLQRRVKGGVEEKAFEFEIQHRDGHRIWTELTTSGVYNQDKLVAIQGVARDITERRQMANQLRQSQKMEAIGQLAGGVAHDFNNILAAIMMQAELSGQGENIPKETRDGLQQISVAAESAANLTRQLLMFSRRQVIQARNLNLNDVVTDLTKMLQRLIGADVRLQLHLHPVPLVTHADAGMLDQVLLNLAVNARDAMPRGGSLLIETSEKNVGEEFARLHPDARTGRYVCLAVSDTGTGIPPEILPRIYEPFFTTKEPGKGTGLGLAIVFGIVQQHGGFLQVESEPGRGTKFQLFLPASQTVAAAAAVTVKPKPRGGTETILLVEDEESVRSLVRALLKRNGYQVIEAANGVDALKVWKEKQDMVALLLTDLVMPAGVSGHELGNRLQQDRPKLKVIYLSGYSPEIAGRQIQLKPGENFLQKPFQPDQLMETIRQCLDN